MNNKKLTYRNFIEILNSGGELLTEALKDANLRLETAYFWECPPLSSETIDKPFEFVVTYVLDINSHSYGSFQSHINENSDKLVCSFPNLEKDAMLVIPIPSGLDYRHIKSFIDSAPSAVQKAL